MPIKFRLENKDDIPAALADAYRESKTAAGDTVWELDVEGAVSQEKLREFRDTNNELKEKVESLEARYKGIDPGEARTLKERADLLDDKKLVDAGKMDELVNQRTEAMRKQHEEETAEKDKRIRATESQLSRLTIDQALISAGAKLGLRPEANDDLVYRGRNIFELKDGAPVATGEDGKPIYDEKSEPLSIAAYVEKLTKNAPHLFQESSGGGADPAQRAGGVDVGANPWDKGTWNVTRQMHIMREDRSKAERMANKAGHKLAPESAGSLA